MKSALLRERKHVSSGGKDLVATGRTVETQEEETEHLQDVLKKLGLTKEEADDLYCLGRMRPTWRGLMHRIAFVASPIWASYLLYLAKSNSLVLGVCLFLFSLVGLFGVSSSFHRNEWTVNQERFMGKLDYAFIFCVVGFTAAPSYVALLPDLGWYVVGLIAATVVAGVFLVFFDCRRTIGRHSLVFVYICQAFLHLLPLFVSLSDGRATVFEQFTSFERMMLYTMGAMYLVGSQIFAHRWPDPIPSKFGYHEIWHMLILLAASCGYVMNASGLLRVSV